MVGIAGQGVKQLRITGRLVMGDGGFHQVAGTVHLVPVAQIFPAHFGLNGGEMGVEIAIGLLRADNLIGHCIDELRQRRVVLRR